ncbi:hypothetical protein [Bacillus piscicola]|uniref:hypothetical protein n=1 Tax=Bacillus piscicola TaxID=1632684 RepID=UPI001F089243|nr:hypothetical protein [Bacillus piscicola]
MANKKEINLTTEKYKWLSQKITDAAIAQRYGVSYSYLRRWKLDNDVPLKKKSRSIKQA